jgi:hypothetical protein
MNSDSKFKLHKELDSSGCTPKCVAHLSFGLDICEITSCKKC